MLCAIFYLEKTDKARFYDPKKRIKNNYFLNNAEYTRTVTALHRLLLNLYPNYNSNRKYQYQGVRNQLIFHSVVKLGMMKVKKKDKQNP